MLSGSAFWFLRHGETDWNAKNLAQGRVDIPLNETGRLQARAAAQRLHGRGIRSIVASPLSRAKETAAAAAETIGATVSYDEELQEVAFGDHEGQPMLTQWFDDWVAGAYTPAGGESFAELRERAIRAVDRAREKEAPVLVVAHGALFRALRSAMGLDPNFRTANGIPIFCQPGTPWTLTAAADIVP